MKHFWFSNGIDSVTWPDPHIEIPRKSENLCGQPLVDLFGAAGPWLVEMSGRLDVPVDPLGLNLMVAVSALLGPNLRIKVGSDWEEPAVLWGAHVASSPAMLRAARRPFVIALRAAIAKRNPDQHSAPGAVVLDEADAGAEPAVLFWDDLGRDLGHAVRNGEHGDPKLASRRDVWDGSSFHSASGPETGDGALRSTAIFAATDRDQLAGALEDEPSTEFLSRLLYVCDHGGHPNQLVQCDDEMHQLIRALQRVHGLRTANDTEAYALPTTMPLSSRAYQEFDEWRLTSDIFIGGGQRTFGIWSAHIHGQVVQIALALEILEWAFGTEAQPPDAVTSNVMNRAISLVEGWLVVHMRHAFGLPSRTNCEAHARELAGWICRQRPTFIKPVALLDRRKVRGIRSPDAMNAACLDLCLAGWMAPVKKVVDYRATFMINPRLLKILSGTS
jgi:hypothetical protein